MLGAREIEVIMRVRVRLHLNACVSRRMCESWQLCQRWALVLFDALLLFQFISCASLFLCFIPSPFPSFSSLLHPLLTFLLLPSFFCVPPLPSFFPRFQAPVEIEGSGGGLLQLLECFPCTTNQQLVNRTCIDGEAPTDNSIGTRLYMCVRYKCLNLEMTGEETLAFL